QILRSFPRFPRRRIQGRVPQQNGREFVSPPPKLVQNGARKCWQRRRCDKTRDRTSIDKYSPAIAGLRQLGCKRNDPPPLCYGAAGEGMKKLRDRLATRDGDASPSG